MARPPERSARAHLIGCVLMGPLVLAGCGARDEAEDALLRQETALDAGLGAGDAVDASSLYPQVADIIARSCGYERCHAGPLVGAGLRFEPGTDYRAVLVGVRACEYDRMARVEPGDPDRSWLMIKLTAPFRPLDDPYAHAIYFTPPAGWDPSRRGCRDQTRDGVPLFGQRMPATAPNSLPPAEIDLLRRWIAGGALP